MPDDSGNSSGNGGGQSTAPASLEDHNARTGIIVWPHKKRPAKLPKRRTGNRLLDLIHD